MAVLDAEQPAEIRKNSQRRNGSKPKVSKKTPDAARNPKSFICEGQSCDLVRRVLISWGWVESESTPETCTLKWTFRSRDAEKSPLQAWQLINHFHGSYYLSNKAFLGQCLQCCACCSHFFPRQHDLRNAAGMRTFLRDFVLTAAEQAISQPGKRTGAITAKEAAVRVLRRYKDWAKSPQRPEKLLRCPHEVMALLGDGCLLPRKLSIHQRAHVDAFLSRALRSCGECPTCSDAKGALFGGETHPDHQKNLDGPQNVWALKEPCVQKGKGVTVLSGLARLLEEYDQHRSMGQGRDCVAQKYIERPLLINRETGPAKCDLRVWVLVLDWNPLTAFVHPEVYFRIATLPFDLESMLPNAHKTNCRDEENRTPMKAVFELLGAGSQERWAKETWPRLLDAVRFALFAARAAMTGLPPRAAGGKAFELFGLDFGLDENWRPWLLELNTSPCMLDDCKGQYEEAIKSWAWEATEGLLRMVLALHDGSWKLPSPSELQEKAEGTPCERLFEEGCCSSCLAQIVSQTPTSLAAGLSLDGPCGRWRLVLREKALDEMALRQAHEALQRRMFQGISANELSVSKLLREWLLPAEEVVEQEVQSMSKTCSKSLRRATSQPARRTEGGETRTSFRDILKAGTSQL
ncbi:unnamed protein product [Effrenium voratum]|nr:unnamed protein product [Effrenium voratum]